MGKQREHVNASWVKNKLSKFVDCGLVFAFNSFDNPWKFVWLTRNGFFFNGNMIHTQILSHWRKSLTEVWMRKLNGVQQLRWSDGQTLLPDKKPKTQESLQTTASQVCPKARFFWEPQFIRKIRRDSLQKQRGRHRLLLDHFVCMMLRKKKVTVTSAICFQEIIISSWREIEILKRVKWIALSNFEFLTMKIIFVWPDWLLVRPKLDPGLTNDLLMDKNYLQACIYIPSNTP